MQNCLWRMLMTEICYSAKMKTRLLMFSVTGWFNQHNEHWKHYKGWRNYTMVVVYRCLSVQGGKRSEQETPNSSFKNKKKRWNTFFFSFRGKKIACFGIFSHLRLTDHYEWMNNGLFCFLWISHWRKPAQGCWTKSIQAPAASANFKPDYSKCVLKVAKALVGDLVAETQS